MHSIFLLSNNSHLCHGLQLKAYCCKKKKGFAYLFRNNSLTLFCPPPKHSVKKLSLPPYFPPNRSNAVLNLNFKCNIFYLYFILILFLVCFTYDFFYGKKQLELCINFVRKKKSITQAKVELQCKLRRTFSLIN